MIRDIVHASQKLGRWLGKRGQPRSMTYVASIQKFRPTETRFDKAVKEEMRKLDKLLH